MGRVQTIEDLELSIRSYNCLRNAGINSIAELVKKDDRELLALKNFGRKSLREVKDQLQSVFLHQELVGTQGEKILFTDLSTVDLTSKEVLRNLNLAVQDLELSTRCRCYLVAAGGIRFVWQLVQVTEPELLKMKNLGRKSLNEIKRTMHSFGFNLGTSLSPEQVEKIKNYHHVPDSDFLKSWFKKTVHKLSHSPLDFLTERQEQVVRGRTWVTGKKPTFEQLGQLLGVSRERIRNVEKTSLLKIRRHFIKRLVEINYYLLGEFAAHGNCIKFSDIVIDLYGLSRQEQAIADSLLGLAVEDITIDREHLLLILDGFTPQDIEELGHYIFQEKGSVSYRFITKNFLREQRRNEDIVQHQDEIYRLKWLAP